MIRTLVLLRINSTAAATSPPSFIAYQVLLHLLHSRPTDHIAGSQKYYSFSHHSLCNCHSFCLGCSSLRSVISCRFFSSIVSFPYDSEKSHHIPFPSLLSIPSPYFPSLQDTIYYLKFFHGCIHSFIIHFLH